jgi:hypothetical protein
MPAEIRSGRTLLDVALALRVLTLYSGNITRASIALVDAGERVSPRTLARWRDSHPDLYWDLQREAEQDAAQATVIRALTICEARLESLSHMVKALRRPGPA